MIYPLLFLEVDSVFATDHFFKEDALKYILLGKHPTKSLHKTIALYALQDPSLYQRDFSKYVFQASYYSGT